MAMPTPIERLQKALDAAKSQFVEVQCDDVLVAVAEAGSLEVDQVLYALHKGSKSQRAGTKVNILVKDLQHALNTRQMPEA